MLIDIKDIAREGTLIERVMTIGTLRGSGNEPIPTGVTRVRALLSRGSRGVDFSCRVESSLTLECARCLEPYEMPVSSDFHLVFVSRMPAHGTENQLEEEDCELYPVSEGKVDLPEVLREQLYLSIPLKPLCREDCCGLCPRCGINRNTASCDCEALGQNQVSSPSIVWLPRSPKQ